jgi:hypothetical protein
VKNARKDAMRESGQISRYRGAFAPFLWQFPNVDRDLPTFGL